MTDTCRVGLHLTALPNLTARVVNEYRDKLFQDNYHLLAADSARLLVREHFHFAKYVGGWGSATLWELPSGKRVTVYPYLKDFGQDTGQIYF